MKKLSINYSKSIIALALILALTFVSLSINVSAASWRTGNVPDESKNTSAITVSLTNKNKKGYIKLHGYVKGIIKTKEKNCKFHVTMRDNKGKWLWEGDVTTGSKGVKLKLGKDHSVYKIYLKHIRNVHCLDVGHNCPTYWGIECKTNCSVK